MLEGYASILQVDGYAVYEKLFGKDPDILLVYCMAHARRKFVDALKYDKERSTYVLERMQVLYALEQQMREQNLDWEEKTKLRQVKSAPALLELKEWMTQQLQLVIPKSPLGQAIAYSLPRWKGLSAYALHGQIEIDNNLAENVIRPLAIGRKAFLFAGSHQAAEMTAAMYSFMATCKKNGVDEQLWLTDLYQLLPNNWKKFRNLEN